MHPTTKKHCFIVYLKATFTYWFSEDDRGLPGVASVITEQQQQQTQIHNYEFGPNGQKHLGAFLGADIIKGNPSWVSTWSVMKLRP